MTTQSRSFKVNPGNDRRFSDTACDGKDMLALSVCNYSVWFHVDNGQVSNADIWANRTTLADMDASSGIEVVIYF